MTFKPLNENDVVSTRTLLHEAIPLTGTIVQYPAYTDLNIKNYSHGMFQSVYDYPVVSSSANHIFDITVGCSPLGIISAADTQYTKKKNIYNQMAQILMGYDSTGSIQQFDEDGNIIAGGNKNYESFIIPFSRLLVKDEIKKETFSFDLGVGNSGSVDNAVITIADVGASTEYRVNSPAGEYGILYATGSALDPASGHTTTIDGDVYQYAGLLYYQAGIAVITGSVLGSLLSAPTTDIGPSGEQIDEFMTGSSIQDNADMLRTRIINIQFNNTTELNSTVYFCRINHNEFNYSSNPTYTENSRIRVKTQATHEPVSYITTVGLYSDNNELLATAKLSEPLKKTPSTEFTIRARLDF